MTVTVKAMDSQRWVCRTQLFQFNETSSEDETGSWDPREEVDELPAHHLPAVARAGEVLLLVRPEARLHEGQARARRRGRERASYALRSRRSGNSRCRPNRAAAAS